MENTKKCKACMTEIHEQATKCLHCRTYQSKWQSWYILFPILLLFPLIIFLMNMMSFNDRSDFKDYKGEVTYTFISKEIIESKNDNQTLRIIGEIDNKSEKDWKSPDLKIIVNDEKGEFYKEIFSAGYNEDRIKAKSKTKISNISYGGKLPERYSFDIELAHMIEVK